MCLFLFGGSVSATSKISLNETANGKVASTFHFEEGFVGGIEVTFKVEGSVKVEDFTFASQIASSNYTKLVTKDSASNTITIRVTTGGIGSEHNLLNQNKELTLGELILSSSQKENTDYMLESTKLSIVDNNWATKTFDVSTLTYISGKKFTYVVKAEADDNPKEDDSQNAPEDNSSSTGGSTQTSGGSNAGSQNPSNSENGDGNQNNPSVSDDSSNNPNATKPESDKQDKDNINSESSNNQKSSSIRWLIPLIIGSLVVIVVVLICYFYLKKDREEIKM